MPSAIADLASGHSASGDDAMVRALLHPAHRPVMPGVQPALEVEPGRIGGIGAREAAGDEAEPLGFRLIASSRLWPVSTAAPLHRSA